MDQSIRPNRRSPTTAHWIRIGLARGFTLGAVYALAIAVLLTPFAIGSSEGPILLFMMVVVVGVPYGLIVGSTAGAVVGAVAALIDVATSRRHTDRSVAVAAITLTALSTAGAVAAANLSSLTSSIALNWVVTVAVPAALGLVSLVIAPLPTRHHTGRPSGHVRPTTPGRSPAHLRRPAGRSDGVGRC